MKPCALIPALNEENNIGKVVTGALRHVTKVIVVDDGSADGTARASRDAGAEVVIHGRNFGKGAALRSGLAKAFEEGYDPVVILDADGQHDCREIPLFMEAARAQAADIVVGNRMGETERMPRLRYLTNRITSFFVSRLAGQRIPDSQCGFRLINEKAFRTIRLETSRYETESEMLIEAARAGCRIGSVPIRTIYGVETSRIHPLTDTVRFIRLILRHLFRHDK